MEERFQRTGMLIGEEGIKRLSESHVAVFGIGGVGGYVAEALARCGIGEITLVDRDVVSMSNLNRQIIALESTVGRMKTRVMKERIEDICPDTVVHTREVFFL
ncbi:MAG: ThiF family adenylyltransferase, partial [Frisingicoccus sp.]|nr:ThiF family adenylyltransferase [Frisingicoccus sp.]